MAVALDALGQPLLAAEAAAAAARAYRMAGPARGVEPGTARLDHGRPIIAVPQGT